MSPKDEQVSFSAFATEPIYNVKAVCIRTGITAATLRAWERRYGLPQPDRSGQGYRLYSERDLAVLFWLRNQTERGINIAHAAAQLRDLIDSNVDIEIPAPPLSATSGAIGLRSPAILRQEIYEALTHLDERTFERLMNEALAIYTIETSLINILQGAVNDVRAYRKQGKISTTTENMAVRFAHQRLLHMAQTLPNVRGAYKTAITIGFAAEHNEFDLMIVNVLLRRQGIPVTMLGADLEPRMLTEAVSHLNAGILIYYADEPRNVVRLVGVRPPVNSEGERVRFVCCGQALQAAPELLQHLDCEYLGADLRQAVHIIIEHIQKNLTVTAG
jgi:MerR family transcriptional regulator, light-induced transcriptional regulator